MADLVTKRNLHSNIGRSAANPTILVSGADHVAAMEHHYLKYLKEFGVNHQLFAAQGIFYKYYNASSIHKILFKLGLSSIYRKINSQLLKLVKQLQPDVLFVFKGMELYPETLKKIKQQGVILVNFNPDNPFLFTGAGSGNKNVSNSISLFDLYLTYDRRIKEQLVSKKVKAEVLPFGFDITEEQVKACAAEPEIIKLCFLGSADKERATFLNQVADQNIPIDVYGNDWDRFHIHSSITIHPPVYDLEYWKVLRKYRVQLNLMRIHNPQSHNMRSFEVPAVGGIGLFPDTPDHRNFFEHDKEVFLYTSAVDCVSKVKELLQLAPHEATTIRVQARTRSLEGGYSYKNRTHQFLEYLKEIA